MLNTEYYIQIFLTLVILLSMIYVTIYILKKFRKESSLSSDFKIISQYNLDIKTKVTRFQLDRKEFTVIHNGQSIKLLYTENLPPISKDSTAQTYNS